MSATYELPRDIVTFRTHPAKRKSAVEILKATKSLYVKSPKCQGNSKLPLKREYTRKCQKTTNSSDQLQSKLRKLLESSSKENITDWDCLEDINFKFYPSECNVQYQSLPDLSISSMESLSCTINQPLSDSGGMSEDKMTTSSVDSSTEDDDDSDNMDNDEVDGSSEKSYGKPPSLIKSLLSLGGSTSKLEERLTAWTQPKHAKITRSKSWVCEMSQEAGMGSNIKTSVSKELNNFFEHLGLSSDEYRTLTTAFSRTSSPVFFSSQSESDDDSSRSLRVQRLTEGGQSPVQSVETLSVVQTNARVVKWLCRLSQS